MRVQQCNLWLHVDTSNIFVSFLNMVRKTVITL